MLQKQPDSLPKAAALRSLGNVLQAVGELDQSRRALQQSLTIAQRAKSSPETSTALLSLGGTAQAQQDLQAASAFYRQAETQSKSPTEKIQAQLAHLDLIT